jgi:ABC-type transport system involved in multi-copper enzyme maturation permease subunit
MSRKPAVAAVAFNTFRETVRDRIFYSILVFAVFVIALTYWLADLSVADFTRVLVHFGFAAIHVFSVLVSIFLGTSLLAKEVDKRTVYFVLSKPVPRWQFVVGKGLGLYLTSFLSVLFMTAVLQLLVFVQSGDPRWLLWWVSAGIVLEIGLLIGFSILFSTFTTPTLSALFSCSVFVIGHLTEGLGAFAEKAGGAGRWMAQAFFHVLPDLELFNFRNDAMYATAAPEGFYSRVLLYWGAYLLLLLAAAVAIFSRRDLK